MPLYLKQGIIFLFVKVVLEYSLGLDSIIKPFTALMKF